jgi:hypothetical protein
MRVLTKAWKLMEKPTKTMPSGQEGTLVSCALASLAAPSLQ